MSEELSPWAERMRDALERIVEGLEDYHDRAPADTLSVDDVLRIARRALNPEEWERIT